MIKLFLIVYHLIFVLLGYFFIKNNLALLSVFCVVSCLIVDIEDFLNKEEK